MNTEIACNLDLLNAAIENLERHRANMNLALKEHPQLVYLRVKGQVRLGILYSISADATNAWGFTRIISNKTGELLWDWGSWREGTQLKRMRFVDMKSVVDKNGRVDLPIYEDRGDSPANAFKHAFARKAFSLKELRSQVWNETGGDGWSWIG